MLPLKTFNLIPFPSVSVLSKKLSPESKRLLFLSSNKLAKLSVYEVEVVVDKIAFIV